MIVDAELAAAIEGRPHWQPTADGGAEYAAPGAAVTVRVRALAMQARRERYGGAVVRDGRATFSTTAFSAQDAVRWAERAATTNPTDTA